MTGIIALGIFILVCIAAWIVAIKIARYVTGEDQ